MAEGGVWDLMHDSSRHWGRRPPNPLSTWDRTLRTAFASLRVTCSVFEPFLLLAFGHLFYFATVPFARLAPLPLVAN
jgi:hypothetical protein